MKIKRLLGGFIGLIMFFAAGTAGAENQQSPELSRAVLKIESLSCGRCLSNIDSGLSNLEGYLGLGANLSRKLVAVDFVAPLTAEGITKNVSESGYPAVLETVELISEKQSFATIESNQRRDETGGKGCCGGCAVPNKGNTQGSAGISPPSGGACCPLPAIAGPTKKS